MKSVYRFLLDIVVTLQITAYCHTGNPTASGVMPQVGMCAVDKINGQWIPFGTRITTEDGRVLTVIDVLVVCQQTVLVERLSDKLDDMAKVKLERALKNG